MATVSLPGLPMTTALANTTYVQETGLYSSSAETLIDINSTAGVKFQINGTLISDKSVLEFSNHLDLTNALDVVIGKSAWIESEQQVFSIYGDGSSLVNNGLIFAREGARAVLMSGDDLEFVNTGKIMASGSDVIQGILLEGDNFSFRNSGSIHGPEPIYSNSNTGSNNTIVNSGDVYATSWAIIGDDGNDTLINSGFVRGGILLGDGDDTFIDKGGRISGILRGDDGNDSYTIRSTAIDIREDNGDGFDRMKSTVSFTLDNNVEEGTLLGKANLNLNGTEKGDLLYGNNGNNKILGDVGADWITGGKGNDLGDFFVFKNGSGRDVITDFQDGLDKINLQDYKGIDAIGDLKGHFSEAGNNTVITFEDGDQVTLLGVDRSTINGADFQF
jgi:Ca2+-binding RTX toxin-like protein